jgi:hypothetical protein
MQFSEPGTVRPAAHVRILNSYPPSFANCRIDYGHGDCEPRSSVPVMFSVVGCRSRAFFGFALVGVVACGGTAPAPAAEAAGPTAGEQRMYQAGYQDGREREARLIAAAVLAKDAELGALRTRVASVQREASAQASEAASLRVCEAELQATRSQLLEAEARSSAQQRMPESSSPRANGFTSGSESESYDAPASSPCCKVCRKGKACGNSCISRSKECHKGAGCACDG